MSLLYCCLSISSFYTMVHISHRRMLHSIIKWLVLSSTYHSHILINPSQLIKFVSIYRHQLPLIEWWRSASRGILFHLWFGALPHEVWFLSWVLFYVDWVGNLDYWRSTGGYIFFDGNLISWSFRKHPIVSHSIMKATYMEVANATT